MLSKLLKYDFSYICKALLPFYIISLLSAGVSKLIQLWPDAPGFILIIGTIVSGLAVSFSTGMIFALCLRIWARFRHNFYGDEAYLTHTLPVKKSILLLAKTLAAIIMAVITMFVWILTYVILLGWEGATSDLFASIMPKTQDGAVFVMFLMIFTVMLEALAIISCGFTGILLGQKTGRAKGIFSLLFGGAIWLATSLVSGLILLGLAQLTPELRMLVNEGRPENLNAVRDLLLMGDAIYIIATGAIYIVNLKLFNRGVDVE